MNFNQDALLYILLILPGIFTMTVFFQGVSKLKNNNRDGWVAIVFSVIFLILIIAACLLFIL